MLVGAWENVKGEVNRNGILLVLTLARYFKRWSLWSKDIIFLVTPDSITGPQAWVDAYHDAHDSSRVLNSLRSSRGPPGRHRHRLPAGGNGLKACTSSTTASTASFPTSTSINSVVSIAGGQMGMGVSIQEMWRHDDRYPDRLRTMLRGIASSRASASPAARTRASSPTTSTPSPCNPTASAGRTRMAMGRVIEGTFRSLQQPPRAPHQSFFFYLLMQRERFVSIGTYLPSAMLIAANFTIMAIFLWIKSGHPLPQEQQPRRRAPALPPPRRRHPLPIPRRPPPLSLQPRPGKRKPPAPPPPSQSN